MAKKGEKIFTIVIPTLNEHVHLPRLLNDLNIQTIQNFNVVVVDAKSDDGTQNIASKMGCFVIESPKKNVSYQRNMGVKASKTDWVIFMDADNRVPKSFIYKITKYINKHETDILSTWLKSSSQLKKDKLTATIMNIFMEINKNSSQPYVMESMIIIKKNIFMKLGGFDVNVNWREGEGLLKKAKEYGFTFEFIRNPKYTYSFRRLKKIGAFKMFQEMSQMEIIKLIKGGKLTKEDTELFYPMKGGKFYNSKYKEKVTLQKFISILFQDNTVSKKSVSSFKKSLNTWKSLFG